LPCAAAKALQSGSVIPTSHVSLASAEMTGSHGAAGVVGLAGAVAVSTLSAVRQSCALHASTAAL
jgi:hypothetical protein